MSEPKPIVAWEYRIATFKNPEAHRMQSDFDAYGRAGWELVSLTTTVKTMVNITGNDLVAIFKRPTDTEADLALDPAAIVEADAHAGWM